MNTKNASNYKYYEETILSGENEIVLAIWDGEQDKPVIVFLPGTMGYPQTYIEFLEPLSTLGYNIVGVNFVSHGKSPRTKKNFNVQDLVQNTVDAITYASGKFSDRIIVLGHSQGGIVASKVAAIDSRPKAVIAHNVLITTIPGAEKVTNIKIKLTPLRVKIAQAIVRLLINIFPLKKIKTTDYINNVELAIENIEKTNEQKQEEVSSEFKNQKNDEQEEKDPYALSEYPFSMVGSLFALDTSFMLDGSIKTPFYLIAVPEDEIFPYQYMKDCYKAIKAPEKHFIKLECHQHMSLTGCPELSIKILTEIFDKY